MYQLSGKKTTFELNDLQLCGHLIYCEGPLLSHYESKAGDHYLVCWVDTDEQFNRWLIVRVSIDSLRQYVRKEITLLHILNHPADGLVWVTDIDNEEVQHNTQVLAPSELPTDYLPEKDSFYEYETDDPTLQTGSDTDVYEIHIPKKDNVFLSALTSRMGWRISLSRNIAVL